MRRLAVMPVLTLASLVAILAPAPRGWAQGTEPKIPEAAELIQIATPEVQMAAGGEARAHLELTIAKGWHVNANPPALDYMIPTEVELRGGEGITAAKAIYPAAKKAKLSFEDSELWVYDGTATVQVPLTAATTASPGRRTLHGTLHFQACNDQVCLAPATVTFQIPVEVVAGAAPGASGSSGRGASAGASAGAVADSAAGDTTTRASSAFQTAPPPGAGTGSAAVGKRLEVALASGGLVWFLALFVGGLFLNLTPCVFPMLGVTVSIFGARRQQPLPKVLTAAALYVLGIVVMYSTLGVIAALTGSLFGAALQSAWVGIALGALLIGLSLSMFGVYEMQPPAWLLTRLGGADATSTLGLFLSGLVVGVIAAPCIGPFVVAVLALIARKGDALFGFQTMFALALGLGSPYLFLASFSNLLQRLPRSGDWMVWVKKVFGVILAGIGVFYLTVALAPDWSGWVLPGALLLGGLYLGFIDRTSTKRETFRLFRWVVGSAAVVVGVAILASTPEQSVAFTPFDAKGLAAELGRGKTAMIDFSADWCAPCHELERFTFTDGRVRSMARAFLTYKVDLTRYDSPEAEGLRRQYGITGVPTVVFLRPDGKEVLEARVEGYIPPEHFLERMRYVGRQTGAMAAN